MVRYSKAFQFLGSFIFSVGVGDLDPDPIEIILLVHGRMWIRIRSN
jgi:hypothetical protein